MSASQRRRSSGRKVAAHRWFFPAALCLALVEIPLWIAAYAGWTAWPRLASAWHGHEMLFGYALAVVAGFLFARLDGGALALLLGAWLLARVVALVPEPGLLLAAAGSLFPLLLAVRAASLFLAAAKKGSNRIFAPIFGGFLLADLLYRGGGVGLILEGERLGLTLAVDFVTLLLVLMGGRIIPAATAARCTDAASSCTAGCSRTSSGPRLGASSG
jgi:uncharacterized protein involved in response to NO